ncbi:MAG: transcriptional repressor [Flavobacteriales bacterium]|nr:transcriptional repressor [Flavobacteriales bacterium]
MGIVRKTKSVKTLLDVFDHSNGALLSVDLVKQLQPQMNKTTVYRILERLEDDGIIHSFKDNEGLQRYAKCKGCDSSQHRDAHPHFQCRDCGKTECLSLDLSVPAVPNHKVDRAELLLIGQCEDCLL